MRMSLLLATSLTVLALFTAPALAQSVMTAEEARTLVSRHSKGPLGLHPLELDMSSLAPEVVKELLRYESGLRLRGVASVEDEVAGLLATYKGQLRMPKLKVLTNSALAKKLIDSEDPGHYSDSVIFGILPSLTTISDDVAKLLATQPGRLAFPQLVELSNKELAERLAKQEGNLDLPQVRTVSQEAAEALAKHEGSLSLGSLAALENVALAERLADSGSGTHGLTAISPAVAEYLVDRLNKNKYPLTLDFDGLTSLSPEIAASLAKAQGGLSLVGLEALTPAAARELAKHVGDRHSSLCLNSKSLSPEAVRELRPHAGDL
jgi:hypothetical protein